MRKYENISERISCLLSLNSVELQSVDEFLSIGSDTIRGEVKAGRSDPMLAQVMVSPVACKTREIF